MGGCARSWAEFSSDRGLVDPQSPRLARPINDTPLMPARRLASRGSQATGSSGVAASRAW